MSKPKNGRSSYTSKGKHSNVASGTLSQMKKARYPGERLFNKFDAYIKGKNPWITISNPNKAQTNRLFLKVRANDHWGDPKVHQGLKLPEKA